MLGQRSRKPLVTSLTPATQRAGALAQDTNQNKLAAFLATMKSKVTTFLAKVDDRYQHFMQERVDTFVSGARYAQWREISGNKEQLEISPEDRNLNGQIATLGGIVVTATLATLYAPFFLLTIPLVIYGFTGYARQIIQEIKRDRRIRTQHLFLFFIVGMWLTGYFVLGGLSLLAYILVMKVTLQAQDRTRKALVTILETQPRTVWVLIDGAELEIPFERLQVGDTVVILAGQMIPIDGVITQGVATIDQHRLTGESQPIEKGVGDGVLAGAVILSGRVYVQVEKTGKATVAAQIGEILENTLDYHLSIEERGKVLADLWLTPGLLLTGLAGVTLGLRSAVAVLGNLPGTDMIFLGPITLLNYLNLASRQQLLIKDGRSLELLHKVDTVIFDKTGTLTLEQPRVKTVHLCVESTWTEETILAIAAAAEQRQSHPIAKAILAAAAERKLLLPAITDAHYELGYGLRVWLAPAGAHSTADSSAMCIRVGSTRFMEMETIAIPAEFAAIQAACHELGHSMVMVAIEDNLVGAIELQPTIRPEAHSIIKALHDRKLTTVIISGDQEAPTRTLARQLGIDRYFANVLPEEKATLVARLQEEGKTVCFVGDGINDAIALKKAEVSVSLRGATTIATDTAQIVLMDQTLQRLPVLFDLSHELERNLMTSLVLVTVPYIFVIGGIFFAHLGISHAIVSYTAVFTAGTINAMSPMFRRRLSAADEEVITPKS